MKNLFVILFLISCGSGDLENDSDIKNSAQKTNKTIQSKVPASQKSIAYNQGTERLSHPGLFHKETSDGLSVGANSGDEISKMANSCRSGSLSTGLSQAKAISGKYSKWPSFWNGLGVCYLKAKKYYNAKTFFQRAIAIDKNYSPAYNNLGVISAKSDYWYAARDYFKKALSYNSSSEVSNFNLGRLYLAFGQGNRAKKYFQNIKDVNFYKKNVVKLLAISYSLSGDHSQANQLFSQVTNLGVDEKLFYALSLGKTNQSAKAKNIIAGLNIGSNQSAYTLYRDVKRLVQ